MNRHSSIIALTIGSVLLIAEWLVIVCAPLASAAALVFVPSPVVVGHTLRLSGSGFIAPLPDTCEVIWNEPPLEGTCTIEGNVVGKLPLPKGTKSGTYKASVCVPRCGQGRIAISTGTFRVGNFRGVVPSPGEPSTLTFSPEPIYPGDTVSVNDKSLPAAPAAGPCVVFWDGAAKASATCTVSAQGRLDASVPVPKATKPGRHTATVCAPDCNDPVRGRGQVAVIVRAATVVVPDLAGKSADGARARLKRAGLQARVSGRGRVVSQRPAAGTRVLAGSEVVVVLQKGAVAIPTVAVPDLTGRRADDTRDLLALLGLSAAVSGDRDGTVVSQIPAPGTRVRPGSIVTVSLGQVRPTPPATTHVPPDLGPTSPVRWSDTVAWAVLAAALGAGMLASRVRKWVRHRPAASPEAVAQIEPEPQAHSAVPATAIGLVARPDVRPTTALVPRPGHPSLPPLRLHTVLGSLIVRTEVRS